MKAQIVFITAAIAVFSLMVSGCKQTSQTETPKPKAEVKDTVKKVPVVNTEEAVNEISKYRAEGEAKLVANKLTRKEFELKGDKVKENIKQKWEKMDAYYDGDKLVRIMLYPHKGISERTEEFYLKDGKLVFAFIQDVGPKHEGKDTGEPGKEFYFQNNSLIKYSNTSTDKVSNPEEEKKLYETKLPYEVSELLEVIGH